MNQNDIIEISQVGNGYIVRPAMGGWFQDDRQRGQWIGATGDYLVFRTMAELQQWLGDHFTHRATPKLVDIIPPHKPNAAVAKKAA